MGKQRLSKEKLSKIVTNIKENLGRESKNAGFVALGFVAGALISKGIDKLIEKHPDKEWLKYLKPVINSGGGILLASATEDEGFEKNLKLMGYGLAGSGAVEGLKLIPVTKDIFNGLGNVDDTRTIYYTEPENTLEDRAFMNMGQVAEKLSLQTAENFEADLPELDATENNSETANQNPNIGSTETGDEDEGQENVSGIL